MPLRPNRMSGDNGQHQPAEIMLLKTRGVVSYNSYVTKAQVDSVRGGNFN